MPRSESSPLTRGNVLRGAGFAAAIVLGAIAVWLIVTSTTQKRIEIGILTGLWGLLLGAYSMFGARREAVEQSAAAGSELAVRESAALERAEDVAARRKFEARLEQLIQRNIATGISREVAGLRGEIAQLRQDLLEKVGGQLRLERIETTRVIGSDLEALQHEVRQLKAASKSLSLDDLLTGGSDVIDADVLESDAPAARTPSRPVERPAQTRVTPAQEPARATVRPAQTRPEQGADIPVESGRPAQAPAVQPAAPGRTEQPAQARPLQPAARQAAPAAPARPTVPAQAATQRIGGLAPARRTPPVQSGRPPIGPAQRPEVQRPESQRSESQRPEVQRPETQRPEVQRPSTQRPETQRPAAQRPEVQRPEVQRPAAAAAAAAPAAAPVPKPASDDPFASLPRIRPFTDFELDPADPTPAGRPGGPLYTGRRRRSAEEASAEASRHARSAEPPAGGRRRRADDSADQDLLARLLARETHES